MDNPKLNMFFYISSAITAASYEPAKYLQMRSLRFNTKRLHPSVPLIDSPLAQNANIVSEFTHSVDGLICPLIIECQKLYALIYRILINFFHII